MAQPATRTLMWCAVGLVLARPGFAQDNFKLWLNHVKDELTAKEAEEASSTAERARVAVNVRSNSNQDETPNVSANSSSLVDTSSASDIVGIALNLSGLSGSTQSKDAADTTSTSATVSTYALYSAVTGEDPLDPGRYCRAASKATRSLTWTLGYDDQSTEPNGSTSSGPIIAGAKWLAYNGRDVCDPTAFASVTAALIPAAADFGAIDNAVLDRFYNQYGEVGPRLPADVRARLDGALAKASKDTPDFEDTARRIAFANQMNDPVVFQAYLSALGADQAKQMVADAAGVKGFQSFRHLDEAAQRTIEEFQQAPQLSFSFLTRQREDGADEYQGQAILDIGLLVRRLNLTANASYEGSRGGMDGAANGGRVAVQLMFQPLSDELAGPKPLRLSLGFNGAWASGEQPAYQGQFKVNLPVPRIDMLSGLEFPLSVTIANRSELVDETEVRGLVGFTLDTSQVLAALMGL